MDGLTAMEKLIPIYSFHDVYSRINMYKSISDDETIV
jgi:hypothetical protein